MADIAAPAVTAPERARRHRMMTPMTARLVAGAFLLGAWHLSAITYIGVNYISTPGRVLARLIEWIVSGEIFFHIFTTLQQMVVGLLIGMVLGILSGLALGRTRYAAPIFEPFLNVLYSIPKSAIAPLFILWFGIGLLSKIVLVATVVFFLTFYNSFRGAREVNPDLINAVRIMGASSLTIFRSVIVPSALIWVVAGVRLAIPYALIAAVVGEMIASKAGLGFLIMRTSAQFDTDGVFAALVILMIVAMSLEPLVRLVEKKALLFTGARRPNHAG